MSRLEDRLRDAMHAGLDRVEPSPDLFERVQGSLEDQAARRRWRARIAAWFAAALGGFVAPVFGLSDYRGGHLVMKWWVLELLTTAALVAIALLLGPFIKRFGKSYAADVFRANPSTGKSFIVLTDFAYYLIFLAYILFTTSFQAAGDWGPTVNANQLKAEVARVGGIVLIIGILHGLNLLALPAVGRLLSLNRRLDEDGDRGMPAVRRRHRPSDTTLPAGSAWVLRIEPVQDHIDEEL